MFDRLLVSGLMMNDYSHAFRSLLLCNQTNRLLGKKKVENRILEANQYATVIGISRGLKSYKISQRNNFLK